MRADHPDVQPIELFWLNAKNPIGRRPAANMRAPMDTPEELGGPGLYERLRNTFGSESDAVKKNAWDKMNQALAAYRVAVPQEKLWLAAELEAADARDQVDENGVDLRAEADVHELAAAADRDDEES